MRKILAILIIIILAGGYFYYLNNNDNEEKTIRKKEELTKFDNMIQLNEYQDEFYSPNEVVERNNIILLYLYGGELADDEEIRELIRIQRNLLDPDLLEINPYEEQIEKVRLKVEEYKESGYKIIEIRQDVVKYEASNPKIAIIKVIQYTNSNTDNYLEYYLRQQENGTWRILAWEIVDEFSILNEF